MVIAPGGDEGRLVAEPLCQRKAENAGVERQRPVEIGHLEMDMTDFHAGIDRACHASAAPAEIEGVLIGLSPLDNAADHDGAGRSTRTI